MRYDKNLAAFAKDADWSEFVVGIGYVPTDKAPEDARRAMEDYNSYAFPEWHQKNNEKSIDRS